MFARRAFPDTIVGWQVGEAHRQFDGEVLIVLGDDIDRRVMGETGDPSLFVPERDPDAQWFLG